MKRTPLFEWDCYGLTLVVLAFVLTVLVSALAYKYIEIALSNKLKKFLLESFKHTNRSPTAVRTG
ncbi:hypothetical protein C7W93_03265 [Glaciimonas sp. PCH181]|nr:hypothetical protein C7W93_03265 [Glaciimonas sp. PCH181]